MLEIVTSVKSLVDRGDRVEGDLADVLFLALVSTGEFLGELLIDPCADRTKLMLEVMLGNVMVFLAVMEQSIDDELLLEAN